VIHLIDLDYLNTIMGFSFRKNEKFLGQLRAIRIYKMERLSSMELTNSITLQ